MNLQKHFMIRYEFDKSQGLSTTDFKDVKVGFTTKTKQGILMQIQSPNGEYISLELNNAGKLYIYCLYWIIYHSKISMQILFKSHTQRRSWELYMLDVYFLLFNIWISWNVWFCYWIDVVLVVVRLKIFWQKTNN